MSDDVYLSFPYLDWIKCISILFMVIHYPRGQSDLTIPLKLCSAKHQIYLHLNDSKSDISVLSVLIDNINQITPLAGWLTFKWGKKPSSRSVNKTFTEIYSALYWGATWWHWREQCRELTPRTNKRPQLLRTCVKNLQTEAYTSRFNINPRIHPPSSL